MNKKEYILSFIDGLEQAKLQQFADDEVMQRVIKKVLLAGAYQNGTLQKGQSPNSLHNFAMSFLQYADSRGMEITNEQIGVNLRACFEGIRLVENAFNLLQEFKTLEEPEEKGNPAR